MSSLRVLLFLLFTAIPFLVSAQKKDEFKQPRILILLDGSSSMVNNWTAGKDRFKAAGDIVVRLMDSIYRVNDNVEFSLRVYGHQHDVPENNCFDTRTEVMFSKNNLTQMYLRLASLHPRGVSPIAYSLKTAVENDFVNERDYAYSLILITDGGESCGGDICNVVKTLLEKKIEFKPYIVSLVDYAPLRDQYACLGTYLLASKPEDVGPVVHTITDAYKKVLAIPIVKPKLDQSTPIPSPSALKIKVEPVSLPKKEPETTVVIKQPELKVEPKKTEPPKETPKAEPVKEPATVTAPPPTKIQVNTVPFTKDKFQTLPTLGYDRISYALFWSTTTPKKRRLPLITFPTVEAEPATTTAATPTPAPSTTKPAAPPAPKPSAPKPAVPKPPKQNPGATQQYGDKTEASFTTKVEPAQQTLLEVYFTDGKGKFYTSTPPMKLVDAKTGAEVKKFYRTIDASGKPDPQTVPAGMYTLLIGKTSNYVTKNITIEPNSSNKITIVVSKGSLTFRYDGKPKRPVSEFVATVKKNFEPGPTNTQKCTDQVEYEPGNYHVEVNTLPILRRTIDLDFGLNSTIDILEPGFVNFTNTNDIGKVALYHPLGDQFVRFYVMNVNGKTEEQKVRLQPGVYEAHFKKNVRLPLEPDVVQKFIVRSNETSQVELTFGLK
jgi:hypothetical protein